MPKEFKATCGSEGTILKTQTCSRYPVELVTLKPSWNCQKKSTQSFTSQHHNKTWKGILIMINNDEHQKQSSHRPQEIGGFWVLFWRWQGWGILWWYMEVDYTQWGQNRRMPKLHKIWYYIWEHWVMHGHSTSGVWQGYSESSGTECTLGLGHEGPYMWALGPRRQCPDG